MTQNSTKLDSHQLAARMRSYAPRPVAPVQPRGVIDFANRGGFTDVMVPVQKSVVSSVPEASTQPRQHVSQATVVVAPEPSQVDTPVSVIETVATKPVPKTQKRKRGRSFSLVNALLVSMAVVLFAGGMYVTLRGYKTTQHIEATASAQSTGGTGEEVKPSENDTASYTVAADLPRYIDIPRLVVHARVLQTDVKSDGSLGTPSNIYDAAWFSQSAKPGSAGGASLIDGHVSGPTQKGVFYGLEKLSAGDIVMIEKGNGEKLYYKVSKIEVVDTAKVDMSKMLLPVTAGKAGLNLISCTGKFNSQTQQFDQRALVYAEQVQI